MPSWRQFLPHVWRLRKSLQCQLLLKLYRPSFSCVSTHTPAHMCAHTAIQYSVCTYVTVIMWMKTYCSHISVWVKSLYLFSKYTQLIPKLWTLKQSDSIVLSGYETVWQYYASLWGVCGYNRVGNKERTLYCLKKLSIRKCPVVQTELAAVSDLTSEPLSSYMPLSLSACLTACLSTHLSLF